MAEIRVDHLVVLLADPSVGGLEASMIEKRMVLLRAVELVLPLVVQLDSMLDAWMATMMVPKLAYS